jgi:hypothetical protein
MSFPKPERQSKYDIKFEHYTCIHFTLMVFLLSKNIYFKEKKVHQSINTRWKFNVGILFKKSTYFILIIISTISQQAKDTDDYLPKNSCQKCVALVQFSREGDNCCCVDAVFGSIHFHGSCRGTNII